MTGMTPERLDTIQDLFDHTGYAPWKDTTADLLDEVYRLRAGIEALARDYRNHYEMHGAAGDEYVVEDGRCVDVDDLHALLNPTEGETNGLA